MVIDLRRARMQRIRPLALATTTAVATDEIAAPPVSEVLDEAPALPSFDVETAPDTSTPAGKLADRPVEIARLFGIRRLTATTRERLEAVISLSGIGAPKVAEG